MRWLIRFRNVACILCMGLCAFAEIYSAAATALDSHAPFWERVVGWFLFLLPIEIIVALILLFSNEKSTLGFNLTILNVLLYAGFMAVDVFTGNEGRIDRSDLLAVGIWACFFTAVLFSARLIRPVIQSSIETIHLRD